MNRRSVLGVGASTVAVGALGFAPQMAQAAIAQGVRYAIFDSRSTHSATFAKTFAERGVETLNVAEGLTSLWQDRLVPHWRNAGGPIVGMTSLGVYNGLAEQARSEARRSTLIGRHMIASDTAGAAHKFSVPREALGAAAAIGTQRDAWPQMVAEMMAHCPADARICAHEWRNIDSTPLASFDLVSWTIG